MQFPELQNWINNITAASKIVAGGIITISLVVCVILITTSFGGERRKSMAIVALLGVFIGALLFFGIAGVEAILKRIATGQ